MEQAYLLHVKRDWNASADHLATLTVQKEEDVLAVPEETIRTMTTLNRLDELVRVQGAPEGPEPTPDQGDGSAKAADQPSETVQVTPLAIRPEDEEHWEKPDGSRPTWAYSTRSPSAVQAVTRSQSQCTDPDGEDSPTDPPDADDWIAERRERFRRAQGEEVWIAKWRQFLSGEVDQLTKSEVKKMAKQEGLFVLDGQGLLHRVGDGRPDEDGIPSLKLRLVVPTTVQQDLLRASHSSLEGGHQGVNRTHQRLRRSFYWRGMYKSVQEFVASCVDCETGKGNPRLNAPSPGNIQARYPFQCVAMDHIPSLPESYKGNTELLIWVCMFTGFVTVKATPNRLARTIAEAYEEAVYRRFGASELIRHDREPGFMSKAFEEFNRMMGQRQRATLAYHPQANGIAERMVQTIVRSIKMYVSDAEQRDWDDYAERLCLTLNNSYDRVRRETPFYLVHGWDPRTTVEAALGIRPDGHKESTKWRRYIQRQHQRARAEANALLRTAQEARAAQANDRATEETGIQVGTRVWLYLDRVREGFAPKLAHKWHGPFRVKEVIDGHTCRLDVQGTGYGVYPLVHLSKLKVCKEVYLRPEEELVHPERERYDFDESLLPPDSFVLEDGVFEVAEVLGRRVVEPRTRGGRRRVEYQVRWEGYDELQWVREEDLHCGGLLFDFDEKQKARSRFEVMQSGQEPSPGLV